MYSSTGENDPFDELVENFSDGLRPQVHNGREYLFATGPDSLAHFDLEWGVEVQQADGHVHSPLANQVPSPVLGSLVEETLEGLGNVPHLGQR